ncbi:hypothetical protein KC342_g107 [Hortaea werneckii]|nr:hypothetical protein KC342_g107 [Hortaea werneckii]
MADAERDAAQRSPQIKLSVAFRSFDRHKGSSLEKLAQRLLREWYVRFSPAGKIDASTLSLTSNRFCYL